MKHKEEKFFIYSKCNEKDLGEGPILCWGKYSNRAFGALWPEPVSKVLL